MPSGYALRMLNFHNQIALDMRPILSGIPRSLTFE
jgi:hypothetical protein